MKTVQLFEITENTDKTEGKGSSKGTGIVFEDYNDALNFTKTDMYKRFAVMGYVNKEHGFPNVIKELKLDIYENWEDLLNNYEDAQQEKIRKRALSRLTEEEKKALGF